MAASPSFIHPVLNFQSLNPSNSTTFLLIHSGFASHREYSLVTPHLTNYHLIIPDLPSHGRSSSRNILFSPADTAALLADLITKESKTGKAHIIGVSLGGYVALYLASKYPDLVESVFVSGCGSAFGGSIIKTYGAAVTLAVFYPTLVLCVSWLPTPVYQWIYSYLGLASPEGLQEDQRSAAGYTLGFRIAGALLRDEFAPELLEKVRARTLVVAAAKDDDVEGTRIMGVKLKMGNRESRAAKVEGMRHVWSLQDGSLFARCLEAWLVNGKVLGEQEVL